MRSLTLTLAALVALAAPAAALGDAAQGTRSAFGAIAMPAHVQGPGPIAVEARIHIADPTLLPADGHLLVGFNSLDGSAHARIDEVTLADGTPLPAEPGSSPGTTAAPRHSLAASTVAGATELVLRGTVWAEGNGRFHIGALALAFNADWSPVMTDDGPAQLYAYTWLGAKQITQAIPFSGQGNDAWAALPAFGLMATCGFLWWLSHRPARAPRVKPRRGTFEHKPAGPRIVTAPPIQPAKRPARPPPNLLLRHAPRKARPGEHRVRVKGAAPFPSPVPRPHPPAPEGPDPQPEPEPAPPIPPLPGYRTTATHARPAPARPLPRGAHAPVRHGAVRPAPPARRAPPLR